MGTNLRKSGAMRGVATFLLCVMIALGAGGLRAGSAMAGSKDIEGPYEPTWESLKKHPTPKWFHDAKFGIFIHWGVYSVPAWSPKHRYSEWYPHDMYRKGNPTYEYHKKTYGDHKEFGYKDFIPMWKAENWDPERWAKLFHEVGVRYVVPVAEHHDGFALWDSELTKWDSVDMGPHRDIIGDLETAVRKYGMKYAPSYHRAQHWWYYTYDDEFDTMNPKYSGLYTKPHKRSEPPTDEFVQDWKARWEEIRDKYKPDFMWFDWKWGHPAYQDEAKQMMADFYNLARKWDKDVAITNKTIKNPPRFPIDVGDLIEMDYLNLDVISRVKWENPRGIGHSFGYNRNEAPEDYNSVDELVDGFADIVSKNGNLLLDVGPKADGTIPEVQKERLRGIGEWLDVNGEAIYGTRPWKTCQEGDIRFTKKGNAVYAICLEWPGKKLQISSMSNISAICPESVESVSLLGTEGELKWSRDWRALTINTPGKKPCKHAYVFKVTLGPPRNDP